MEGGCGVNVLVQTIVHKEHVKLKCVCEKECGCKVVVVEHGSREPMTVRWEACKVHATRDEMVPRLKITGRPGYEMQGLTG